MDSDASASPRVSIDNPPVPDSVHSFIRVQVVEARNLMGKDVGGTSDPYAVLEHGAYRYKTVVVWKSLNPAWHEEFLIPLDERSKELKLTIWDKDFGVKDDFLGQLMIPLEKIPRETSHSFVPWDEWHAVQKRTAKSSVRGDIHLRLSIYEDDRAQSSGADSSSLFHSESSQNLPLVSAASVPLLDLSPKTVAPKTTPAASAPVTPAVPLLAQPPRSPHLSGSSSASELSSLISKSTSRGSVSGNKAKPENGDSSDEDDDLTTVNMPPKFMLQVRVIEARGLKKHLEMKAIDSYVKVKVGSVKERTAVVKDSAEPKWNEEFTLAVTDPSAQVLKIFVCHKFFSDLIRDRTLGCLRIPLTTVARVSSKARSSGSMSAEGAPADAALGPDPAAAAAGAPATSIMATSQVSLASLAADASTSSSSSTVSQVPEPKWQTLEKRSALSIASGELRLQLVLQPILAGVNAPLAPLSPTTVRFNSVALPSPLALEAPPSSLSASAGAGEADDAQAADLPPGPVSCGCASHYELPLVDETFQIPVTRLYTLLFSDESNFLPSLYQRENYENVSIEKWAPGENGQQTRKIVYIKPLPPQPMAPKTAKCIETQVEAKNEKAIKVVEVTTSTPEVPQGTTFLTLLRYCMTSESPRSCKLTVTFEVKFVKSSLVKGMIKKSTVEGVKLTFKAFVEHIRNSLPKSAAGAARPAASPAAATPSTAAPASPTARASAPQAISTVTAGIAGLLLLILLILLLLWIRLGSIETQLSELRLDLARHAPGSAPSSGIVHPPHGEI
ncbi:hypothetical protein CAOG_02816 [Capsaspora owczarzaki ATCC 30864]|uniref:C2 domain-containing protein n=1 Tax=Capsaspora owczarzaki (strain ATCC 30864) TaxID=595528 RepID=A0A0D2U9H3_CAPO3|nr:hypothetical protein CAOG_02816 [Capsaspora owczarzaki ATCC 30864]KJE91721.1 hypothetical protein CAOG_002816 [Capsaspora owczarzaki ATCC 30864]|eukprot:XP_004348629.1 hypothetical protein CAOG_02816 [Capsaspora owczarzaki ATCC 30864]